MKRNTAKAERDKNKATGRLKAGAKVLQKNKFQRPRREGENAK